MNDHNYRYLKSIDLINANKVADAYIILEDLVRETQSHEVGRILSLAQFKSGFLDKALDTIDAAILAEPLTPLFHETKWHFFKSMGAEIVRSNEELNSKFLKFLLTLHEVSLACPENSDFPYILTDIYASMENLELMSASFKKNLVQQGISPDSLKNLSLSEINYWRHFDHMRRTPILDYPSHVVFETYAKCNAKCTFCVYPDMKRQGDIMSMDLIKKIVNDLKQIPTSHKFQLSPFAVNEPFLDKRIFEILDLIETELPNAQITLTSNASPLNENNLRRLTKYDLNYLWLSVVDYRRDVYEEKMKLNYDRLLERLDMIHAAKSEGWFNTRVVMSRLMDNTEHDEAYLQFFRERYPLFSFCLWPYANWLGRTENEVTTDIKPLPCQHWFEFRIDVNGIVQHCCMDGHSEYPWGDVTKNSVLEIYNQPKYRELRMGGKTRLDVDPCNRCNLT